MDYVYRYWTTSNPTSPPRPTPLKWRTIAPSQLSRDGSDLYAKRLVKAFWNRLPPHFLPKIPENINTLIDIEVKEEVWRFSQAHHRTEVPLFEPQTFSYKWSLDGDPYQLLFVMRMSRRVGLIIDQFKVLRRKSDEEVDGDERMAAKKQLMEKVAEKEIAELEWTTIEEADAEDKWEVVESYAEQPSYKRRGGR